MAWCPQETSHYLKECRPSYVTICGFTRPHSVNPYWLFVAWTENMPFESKHKKSLSRTSRPPICSELSVLAICKSRSQCEISPQFAVLLSITVCRYFWSIIATAPPPPPPPPPPRSNDRLFNRLLRLTPQKHQMSALLDLCEGNPPLTSELPSQNFSNAENVSIWQQHNENHTAGMIRLYPL